MAAPATHIVLADKIFDKYFHGKDKKVFYVGTSFPDIRYMGIIDREKTHFGNLTLRVLQSLSSFEAGLKSHSLVDRVREEFMKSRGVYSLVPESQFITQSLKFFEDKVLYEKRSDWNEITPFFKDVTKDELSFGLKGSDIEKWHQFLQMYFTSGPNDQNIRTFVATIGKPNEMAVEIIRLTKSMEDNAQLRNIVEDFYENFEELVRT
ncbi:MAG: hypothetical protein UW75_C0047G0007 [Parcubacteria group bacterium GW2011_GWF2_44_8]|nr:MAG: hypothetical protein UW75_C0047G0007 [Parcubacteria group bacterium GW2011_GWF2_44_8]